MAVRKLSLVTEYEGLNEQIQRTRESLQAFMEMEQKKLKLRQFLQVLAEDDSLGLANQSDSLAELLYVTEYPLRREFVFDYKKNRYVPGSQKPRIDLAELLTLLLDKKGIDKSFEDLMEHILHGGSLDDFLDRN
ncbi:MULTISPECIES: hypothetical protein [unclassified Paenibacillus]|uniref:hypothetical protein n=1 Tax=unclassified Paenibacillus TaxID=185978 RepID=UPI0009560350|nr:MULTISPECIES: hypothetical protein [unclassified Paenibacillus]ASS66736.1 hypothetical protein CIC07_11560 [Paenibacillus sp. RUD330]SIP97112.1 hypothetical protein SAMN05880555_0160 [Paenibacillus sp. RU4X]SIQ15737.1 hypothetical protein SAMN05880570_0160 [Paenibacillus sp. RU4T]